MSRTPADEASRRADMVATQIAARGVRDPAVLAAMRQVPRERFVGAAWRDVAYADRPLPIEAGQTISQPYIVARMIEAAAVGPSDLVLEVGAGSGYASAVLGRLARRVIAVERIEALADLARTRLTELGHANVELHCADGSLGWPAAAPFDAVLVAAGGPHVPDPLRSQLAIGGRLVMPVGDRAGTQQLVKLTRRSAADFATEWLDDVRFVPLIGAHGWAGG